MHVTTRENDKVKENNKTNLHSAVTEGKSQFPNKVNKLVII